MSNFVILQFFVVGHKNLEFSAGLQYLREYFISTYIYKFRVCMLAQMEPGKVSIEMLRKT